MQRSRVRDGSPAEVLTEDPPADGNPMGMMNDMRGMRTPTSLTRRALLTTALVGSLGVALAACGSDDTTSGTKTSTVDTSGELGIIGQWARTSPADSANGAAYFTIQSSTADTLLGVKVDPAVAGMAEMHETKMVTPESSAPMGSGMGGDTTMPMSGGMTMVPMESVDIPAGEDVVFEPGGKHVMLMGLAKPLAKGDSFELTLTFEKAGDITITVPVLDEAP